MKSTSLFLVVPLTALVTFCFLCSSLQAQTTDASCAYRIFNRDEMGSNKVWYDASQARCDDNDAFSTTDVLHSGQASAYLVFEDFGLSVPLDAEIKGIEVVMIRRSSKPSGLNDRSVRLVRYGRMVGKDLQTDVPWDVNWTAAFYGGESHQWGSAWAPAVVNSPHFGVAIAVEQTNGSARAEIDELLVTVHYDMPGRFEESATVMKRICLPSPF